MSYTSHFSRQRGQREPKRAEHGEAARARATRRSYAHEFRCWACNGGARAHATGATDRTGMSKLTRRAAAAASRECRAQHTSTRRAHTAFVWQPSQQPRCPLSRRGRCCMDRKVSRAHAWSAPRSCNWHLCVCNRFRGMYTRRSSRMVPNSLFHHDNTTKADNMHESWLVRGVSESPEGPPPSLVPTNESMFMFVQRNSESDSLFPSGIFHPKKNSLM